MNNKDIERLFKALSKNNFNNLSFTEQDNLLNEFIDMIKSSPENVITNIVGQNGSASFKDMLDKMGVNDFKRMIIDAIDHDAFGYTQLDSEAIINVIEKQRNGEELSQEEEILFEVLMSMYDKDMSRQEDIDFSAFALLKIFGELKEKDDSSGSVNFVAKMESIAKAIYAFAFACALMDSRSEIHKVYEKHGLNKAITVEKNVTIEIVNILIDYFKENNINPVDAVVAMASGIKLISKFLNMSLEHLTSEQMDDLFGALIMCLDNELDDEGKENANETVSEIVNGSNDNSIKSTNLNSPNGEKTDNNKQNIMDLLFDD